MHLSSDGVILLKKHWSRSHVVHIFFGNGLQLSRGRMPSARPTANNMLHKIAVALVISASTGLAFGESAKTVVFDNGSPDFRNSHVSDTDQPLQQAGDFVLEAGTNTITAVRFFGLYGSTFGAVPIHPLSTDDFTIRFFEGDSDKPAVDWIYEFRVGNISRTSLGFAPQLPTHEYFSYEVEIPAFVLAADKTYWLSVFNSTEFDSDFNWFWARSRVGGYWQNRPSDGELWDHPRLSDNSIHYYESAFQLIGVPEPANVVLIALGLTIANGRRSNSGRTSQREAAAHR